MPAVLKDIVVEQGATFELVIEVRKDGALLPLSGYTGSMQIRPTPASATVLGTGTVAIDGSNSLVTVTIPKGTTAGYTWSSGVYDVKIDNGTIAYRVAKGNASLSKGVTS